MTVGCDSMTSYDNLTVLSDDRLTGQGRVFVGLSDALSDALSDIVGHQNIERGRTKYNKASLSVPQEAIIVLKAHVPRRLMGHFTTQFARGEKLWHVLS